MHTTADELIKNIMNLLPLHPSTRALMFLFLLLCVHAGDDIVPRESTLDRTEPGFGSLFPLTRRKVLCVLLLVPLTVVTVAGGLGGGAVGVTMFLLLLGTSLIQSVALANCVVAVSALAQYFGFNAWARRPTMDGLGEPATDYGIAVVLLPMTLLGAKCGFFAYRLFSASLMLLTVIMLVLTLITIKKATRMVLSPPASEQSAELVELKEDPAAQHDITVAEEENWKAAEKSSIPMFPRGKLAYSALMLVVMLVSDLAEGTDQQPSVLGVKMCSVSYFAIHALVILGAVVLGLAGIRLAQNIELGPRNAFRVCGIAFLSGFLVSSTGIGGGFVLNPLLLQMGLAPEVTAATTIFVLSITSSAVGILMSARGQVSLSYFLIMATGGVVGTIAAKVGMARFLRDREKTQLTIVCCVAAILVMADVLIPLAVYLRGAGVEDMFVMKSFCSS